MDGVIKSYIFFFLSILSFGCVNVSKSKGLFIENGNSIFVTEEFTSLHFNHVDYIQSSSNLKNKKIGLLGNDSIEITSITSDKIHYIKGNDESFFLKIPSNDLPNWDSLRIGFYNFNVDTIYSLNKYVDIKRNGDYKYGFDQNKKRMGNIKGNLEWSYFVDQINFIDQNNFELYNESHLSDVRTWIKLIKYPCDQDSILIQGTDFNNYLPIIQDVTTKIILDKIKDL